MANNTTSNPIRIDTWDSDIVISAAGTSVTIKYITLVSAAAGDDLEGEDGFGNVVLRMGQNVAGGMVEWRPPNPNGFTFTNGLTIDVSDSTGLGSGDVALFYL